MLHQDVDHSQRRFSIGYQPSARVPTHLVTPGVVMSGRLAHSALDAWLAQHAFNAHTPATITDPALFRSHVQSARALGCWTEAQLDAGLRCVGRWF